MSIQNIRQHPYVVKRRPSRVVKVGGRVIGHIEEQPDGLHVLDLRRSRAQHHVIRFCDGLGVAIQVLDTCIEFVRLYFTDSHETFTVPAEHFRRFGIYKAAGKFNVTDAQFILPLSRWHRGPELVADATEPFVSPPAQAQIQQVMFSTGGAA